MSCFSNESRHSQIWVLSHRKEGFEKNEGHRCFRNGCYLQILCGVYIYKNKVNSLRCVCMLLWVMCVEGDGMCWFEWYIWPWSHTYNSYAHKFVRHNSLTLYWHVCYLQNLCGVDYASLYATAHSQENKWVASHSEKKLNFMSCL